ICVRRTCRLAFVGIAADERGAVVIFTGNDHRRIGRGMQRRSFTRRRHGGERAVTEPAESTAVIGGTCRRLQMTSVIQSDSALRHSRLFKEINVAAVERQRYWPGVVGAAVLEGAIDK